MAWENAMCSIFHDQLSASKHSVDEDGEAITNIEICISEFGAHLGNLSAVLFAHLADYAKMPQWRFTGFSFRWELGLGILQEQY